VMPSHLDPSYYTVFSAIICVNRYINPIGGNFPLNLWRTWQGIQRLKLGRTVILRTASISDYFRLVGILGLSVESEESFLLVNLKAV